MRHRIARIVLGASLAFVASAPLTQNAHAWTCLGEPGRTMCVVVGTACNAIDTYTSHGALCQLG